MSYQKTTWVSGETPLSAANMNNIETGIEEAQVYVATVSAFSSLPKTVSDANILADHVVVNAVLSNPSAQTGDWTVTTSAGEFVISGSISGSTSLTLTFAKQR